MKILLVDDHALIRDAMRSILLALQADAEVLEASTCHQALKFIQLHDDIALVLLDLRMPDRDGLDLLAELRQRYPAIGVVMLSALNDRESITAALDAGALGFIPKTAPREILLGALRLILAGGVYVPPDILVPTDVPVVPPVPLSGLAPDTRRPTPAELGLTVRQMEVLLLMMQGKNNKLICRALDLAEPTVKNHVSAILKALNVSNRTEAVVAVATLGWELPGLDG
jgi:DNA-binding NarL/FixJ family response regulator